MWIRAIQSYVVLGAGLWVVEMLACEVLTPFFVAAFGLVLLRIPAPQSPTWFGIKFWLTDCLTMPYKTCMSRPLLFFIFQCCPVVSAFPWLSVLPYFMAHWSRNRHLPRLDLDCARSCRSRGECTSRITCLQLWPQHLTLLFSFLAGTNTRMVGRVAAGYYCSEQTNVTWMSCYLCLLVINLRCSDTTDFWIQ